MKSTEYSFKTTKFGLGWFGSCNICTPILIEVVVKLVSKRFVRNCSYYPSQRLSIGVEETLEFSINTPPFGFGKLIRKQGKTLIVFKS